MDVHSGGKDLKFPHHENEILQCMAYSNTMDNKSFKQFIHSGHLFIDGLKMSKSLKNFITIDEMLKRYSSSVIRLYFLMQQQDSRMNYTESAFPESMEKDRQIKTFIHTLENEIRYKNNSTFKSNESVANDHKFNKYDNDMIKIINNIHIDIHNALADNFNTNEALNKQFILINKCNEYILNNKDSKYVILIKIKNLCELFMISVGLINIKDLFT